MLINAILTLSRLIKYINTSHKSFTKPNEIDNAFDMALEELAAEQEVTVDYFMMEFL